MDMRSYRADIDGLRGVAIALVVLFHATNQCPGGFVGVDIFFVISGFLITRLWLEEQQRGAFHLVGFWIRRMRRLLPAATLMVLATLIAGFFFMLPDAFEALSESAVAQQLLVSNVYFWHKTGYFDGSAELKPLLHTWSLAVEEQFYVAYPVVLAFLRRVSRPVMVAVLLALTVVSFGASDWGVRNQPLAAFYLLPMRAWEILLGGLICFAPMPASRNARIANMLAAFSLLGILSPAWMFNAATPFPGRAALLPCAATALLIYANSVTPTFVGRVLGARPLIFTGLISYSLYLWHWPILSFMACLLCGERPDRTSRGIALAASIVVAVLSWRYVELPVRRKVVFPQTKRFLLAVTAMMALLLVASVAVIVGRGLPERFDPQAISYAHTRKRDLLAWPRTNVTLEQAKQGRLPEYGVENGTITCLVWGDSHGRMLLPGVDAACKTRGVRCLQATSSATAPVLEFYISTRVGMSERAPEFNRAIVDYAVAEHVDIVFLCGRWRNYAGKPTFESCLDRTVEELRDAGIHVVLVRDSAGFANGRDPTLQLAMAVQWGRDVTRIGVPLAEHLKSNERVNAMFDRLAGSSVSVFDSAPAFVDETGLWRAEYGGQSMYSDDHHLSAAGALRLQPLFESLFDRLVARRAATE